MTNNQGMSTELKTRMANRLDALMGKTLGMDTLKKVAAKSKVGYGTVRRIRTAESTDVAIGLIEQVATAFGLTVTQFIADQDDLTVLSDDEKTLIQAYRGLEDDRKPKFQILLRKEAKLTALFADDESTLTRPAKQ